MQEQEVLPSWFQYAFSTGSCSARGFASIWLTRCVQSLYLQALATWAASPAPNALAYAASPAPSPFHCFSGDRLPRLLWSEGPPPGHRSELHVAAVPSGSFAVERSQGDTSQQRAFPSTPEARFLANSRRQISRKLQHHGPSDSCAISPRKAGGGGGAGCRESSSLGSISALGAMIASYICYLCIL